MKESWWWIGRSEKGVRRKGKGRTTWVWGGARWSGRDPKQELTGAIGAAFVGQMGWVTVGWAEERAAGKKGLSPIQSCPLAASRSRSHTGLSFPRVGVDRCDEALSGAGFEWTTGAAVACISVPLTAQRQENGNRALFILHV